MAARLPRFAGGVRGHGHCVRPFSGAWIATAGAVVVTASVALAARREREPSRSWSSWRPPGLRWLFGAGPAVPSTADSPNCSTWPRAPGLIGRSRPRPFPTSGDWGADWGPIATSTAFTRPATASSSSNTRRTSTSKRSSRRGDRAGAPAGDGRSHGVERVVRAAEGVRSGGDRVCHRGGVCHHGAGAPCLVRLRAVPPGEHADLRRALRGGGGKGPRRLPSRRDSPAGWRCLGFPWRRWRRRRRWARCAFGVLRSPRRGGRG